jgi:hypothetical protein
MIILDILKDINIILNSFGCKGNRKVFIKKLPQTLDLIVRYQTISGR